MKNIGLRKAFEAAREGEYKQVTGSDDFSSQQNYSPKYLAFEDYEKELPDRASEVGVGCVVIASEQQSVSANGAVAGIIDKILVDEIMFIDAKIKEGHWDAGMGGTKEETMLWWQGQLDRLKNIRNKIDKATASL